MPKVTRNNEDGLVQESGKGTVGMLSVEECELTRDSTNAFLENAAGVTQPANSMLTAVTFVTTEAIAAASGKIGAKVGTTVSGSEVIATVINSLHNGAASLPVGEGTSTDPEVRVALSGHANLVFANGALSGSSAAERALYPRVLLDGGSATAGKVRAFFEFVQWK